MKGIFWIDKLSIGMYAGLNRLFSMTGGLQDAHLDVLPLSELEPCRAIHSPDRVSASVGQLS